MANSVSRYEYGQNFIEYSIAITVVILALGIMMVYTKRGLQGRFYDMVKTATDSANTSQYEPYYQNTKNTVQIKAAEKRDIKPQGNQTRSFSQLYNTTLNSYGFVVSEP